MPVTVSGELIQAAHLTEAELRIEFAVRLFQRERPALGQAARFSDVSQIDFQRIPASRRIAPHYGLAELEQDLGWAKSRLAGWSSYRTRRRF